MTQKKLFSEEKPKEQLAHPLEIIITSRLGRSRFVDTEEVTNDLNIQLYKIKQNKEVKSALADIWYLYAERYKDIFIPSIRDILQTPSLQVGKTFSYDPDLNTLTIPKSIMTKETEMTIMYGASTNDLNIVKTALDSFVNRALMHLFAYQYIRHYSRNFHVNHEMTSIILNVILSKEVSTEAVIVPAISETLYEVLKLYSSEE